MAENKKDNSRLNTDSPKNTGSSAEKDTLENVTRSYQKGWGYAEIAIQYGVAIILCTLIGHWLDNKFNSGYILMITGLIIGSVAGFIGLLKSLNALNTKNKHDRDTKV
jgi:F0F1-type ATP synthase assembly protein I